VRALRPGVPRRRLEPPTEAELEECPLCEGREERTPPETLALGPADRERDTPGWEVRVVPNKFPAFERQEVVVHVPRHARSIVELRSDELALVAEAWQRRSEAARAAVFPYVQALVNEGREAGASLLHTHSQLVWMREPPPAVAAEEPGAIADLLADERYLISERDGVACVCHPAGRAPYELLVAPREPEEDAFASGRLAAALTLVADGVRRLHAVEGASPMNAWLHPGGHWHLEVLPRLTVLAGLELGAGMYLNPLPPDQAAEALREAPT
jgi:UDPglucose--hexose-1-phosphate uridylyltransferase